MEYIRPANLIMKIINMKFRIQIQSLVFISSIFVIITSCFEPGIGSLYARAPLSNFGFNILANADHIKLSAGKHEIDASIDATDKFAITKHSDDTLSRRINDTVSYPGGEVALQNFLYRNNIFNSSKSEYSLPGNVGMKLTINPEGQVINKTLIRSIGGDIDEEAFRLADLLVFNPATDSDGKAISSEYILKIYFNKGQKERIIRDFAVYTSYEPDEFEKLYYRNGPASFPGGIRQMRKYFRENIVYRDKSSKGKVRLLLFINYGGWISGISVLESSDSLLTDEAIRLVKSVGRWKPIIKDNNSVDGFLQVDVKFNPPGRLRN